MQPLRRIIAEVHRRSLWQVLGIYLVGAWVAYQVVLGLTDGIGLPDWVPGFAFVLFLIGLPIVAATAFVNEGPPTRDAIRGGGEPRDSTLLPGLSDVPAPDSPADSSAHWLTWRRSLVAGLVAFVLLGAGTTGFMGMRVMGIGTVGTLVAKGVLEERDGVVLADFSSTADPGLGIVVSEALRIDLMQTTIFRIVDPAYVRDALQRMHHDAADGLPTPVALQLAQREGLKAVLTGDISTLGGSYIVTARLLNPADGAVLAAFKEVARDSTHLIDAVDALSKQIRAKAGESLRTVRASEPLWRVSTASLAALRKYGEAERVVLTTGDQLRAVELLEEALAEDPEFAAAYRKHAVLLNNMGIRRQDAIRSLTRAHELRDRLTELERLYTVGTYHMSITRDDARAGEAYRAVLAIDPTNTVATNNLALVLGRMRRFEEAIAVLEPVVQRPGATNTHFQNLAVYQYNLGQREAAAATIAEGLRRTPENATLQRLKAHLPAAEGDFAAADAELLQLAGIQNTTASAFLLLQRASLLQAQGKLREMDRTMEQLVRIATASALPSQALLASLRPLEARLELLGPWEGATRQLEAVLNRYPLAEIPPADRPYLEVSFMYASAGAFDRAQAMLAEYEREVPPADRLDPRPLTQTRAVIALRETPAPETIRAFRELEYGSCTVCYLAEIGRGYDMIGQADSAIAVYRRYLETPYLMRAGDDAWYLAFVLFRLGELHEERGQPEAALRYYGRLLELLKDADPEFQPRLVTVRRRMQALGRPGD
jgi:tetratricopeptide (TPR) repeat protein